MATTRKPRSSATTPAADTHLVKIRIGGLPAAVDQAAAAIAEHMTVVNESQDYQDRPPSRAVRRYLDVLITTD